MLPENFYKIVEQKGFLRNILYSDTDSIFILMRQNCKNSPIAERLKVLNDTAKGINRDIGVYLNQFLLPKQNISPQYNMTDFKTELLIDSIMFLDVKKSYVYSLVAKEGNILNKPEISYTGIQVVKSDTINMTRDMLKHLIEKVVLSDIPRKEWKNEISKCVHYFKNQFQEKLSNFELEDIGMPTKWQKKDQAIFGMKVYNFIMNEETFSIGSAGKFIYCKFNNLELFNKIDIPDLSKITGVCFPYVFEKEKFQEKLKEYRIEIDGLTQWDKINTTTVQRVTDIIKGV